MIANSTGWDWWKLWSWDWHHLRANRKAAKLSQVVDKKGDNPETSRQPRKLVDTNSSGVAELGPMHTVCTLSKGDKLPLRQKSVPSSSDDDHTGGMASEDTRKGGLHATEASTDAGDAVSGLRTMLVDQHQTDAGGGSTRNSADGCVSDATVRTGNANARSTLFRDYGVKPLEGGVFEVDGVKVCINPFGGGDDVL
eukprot:gene1652-29901_t